MDRPILFGRTARELILLTTGLVFVGIEATRRPLNVANLIVYGFGVLLFAVRFFPARAVGTGTAIAALAQRWPETLYARHLASDLDWTAYAPLVMVPLLASRDLVQRFDRTPSRILRNAWATLPESLARALRWCSYALGALGGILWQVRSLDDPWCQVALVGTSACILLLTAGRAVVLLAIPFVCGAIAWAVLRHADGYQFAGASRGYFYAALGLAAIAATIASVYALRLLHRGATTAPSA
jgi:hypothetical protein